jgi:hypothetical protein
MANCQPCIDPVCRVLLLARRFPIPPQNPVDVFLSGPSRGSLHLLPFRWKRTGYRPAGLLDDECRVSSPDSCAWRIPKHGRHQGFANPGRICDKRDLLVLLVHLIVTDSRLDRSSVTGGIARSASLSVRDL